MSSREDEAAVIAALLDPDLETRAEIVALIPGVSFFHDPDMAAAWEAIRDLPPATKNMMEIEVGLRAEITGRLDDGPWAALHSARALHKTWAARAEQEAAQDFVNQIGSDNGASILAAEQLVARLKIIKAPVESGPTRAQQIVSGAETATNLLTATDAEAPPSILGTGLLPRGCVAIIAAEGGSGKSWLMLRLGLAVASGTPWLGIPTTKGRVGVLSFELPRWALKQRISSIASGSNGLDDLVLIGRERLLGLKLPNDEQTIIEIVKSLNLDLLIVDPFAQIQRDQGDTSECVGPPINSLIAIATISKAAVMAAHHVSKPQGNQKQDPINMLRGHSVIRDNPDLVCVIENMRGMRRLSFPKPRFAETPEPIWLTSLGEVTLAPDASKKQAGDNVERVKELYQNNPGIPFSAEEIGLTLDLKKANGEPVKAITIRTNYIDQLVKIGFLVVAAGPIKEARRWVHAEVSRGNEITALPRLDV